MVESIKEIKAAIAEIRAKIKDRGTDQFYVARYLSEERELINVLIKLEGMPTNPATIMLLADAVNALENKLNDSMKALAKIESCAETMVTTRTSELTTVKELARMRRFMFLQSLAFVALLVLSWFIR